MRLLLIIKDWDPFGGDSDGTSLTPSTYAGVVTHVMRMGGREETAGVGGGGERMSGEGGGEGTREAARGRIT